MDELIEVTEKDGIQSVSARELYEKLEIATAFKDWFPRICDYGFCIGIDFNPLKIEQVRKEGNRDVTRELQDYAISIEMAKQICMLQRTEIGKQYRDYFIRLEKAWNTPEAVMARALQFANKTLENAKSVIAQQKQQLIEQRPKVEVYDSICDSSTLQDLQTVAQTIGLKNVFKVLLADGIILKDWTHDGTMYYRPYTEFNNYLVTKDGKPYDINGVSHVRPRIFVTGKGITWLTKKYSK